MSKEGVKMDGSPSEIGPAHATSEAASAEAHLDDHFSDDEPETELEALQHLPAEERRKALRRLRNRESARRVRARRLAEMSQMGSTLQNLQDENAALKAHVSKLQSHIQSMTMKVYEVTAKYESAVAENAQLRAELFRNRRPSAPGGSTFPTAAATAAAAAAAANGPNSAPLLQLSPFISSMEAGGGLSQDLSAGHVQLRNSCPMDMQRQRHALEEVVLLLKEHKRRHQGAGQDPSGISEIGSSNPGGRGGGGGNPSPPSDMGLVGGTVGPVSDLAVSGLFPTNSSTNNGFPYHAGNMGRFMGTENAALSTCGLGGGGRSIHSEVLTGSAQNAQFMAQVQARMAAANEPAGGSSFCGSFISSSQNLVQMPQSQPLPQLLPLASPSPSQQVLANPGQGHRLALAGQQSLQQQQLPPQQAAQERPPQVQGNSQPPMQLPMVYQQHQLPTIGQQQHQQQQQQVLPGGQEQALDSSLLFGNMSVLSLSAPFYSAASAIPGGSTANSGGLQPISCHSSGPNAKGSCAVSGIGGGVAAPALCGPNRSAPWALDRGANGPTSGQDMAAVLPTWQANVGVGLVMKAEDFTDDLMFLDEYVPQDL